MVTTSRTTIVPRLLGVSVACVVAFLAPAAAGIPEARAADAPACATAALLVSRGLPRQALALLATPGAPTCPDAASDATTAITQSALDATAAEAFAKDKKWESSEAKAVEALRADRDNSEADQLRTQASVEVERAKAGLAAEAEAKKSWFEKLQEQWTSFFDHQLTPVGGLLLPFLGVLFGLVVLARLVVLAVRRWPAADDLPQGEYRPKDVIRSSILGGGLLSVGAASLLASLVAADAGSHPLSEALTWVTLVTTVLAAGCGGWTAWRIKQREVRQARPWAAQTRRAITWLSVAATLLVVAGLVIRLAPGNQISDPPEPLAVLGLAAVLAIQGVWLLAWWLATRIRLDVKGPTAAAEVGTVVAVLYELGAEKPRGLEVPRGADVTALDGALGSLPENPVLKVLKDIIRSISGVTPWTATIEGDATARVVTVVRNGRTLGSAIIDPTRLGLTPEADAGADADDAGSASGAKASTTTDKTATPDRTLQMAAAFVLATMAKEHPIIARGLAGATTWKSLGYQYVGSTMQPPASDPAGLDHKRALLASALDEDSGNRAARLAFRHVIDRDAKDCQTLCRYATFLNDFCADLDDRRNDFDTAALTLRARYTRALILVNAVYAHDHDGHETESGTCEQELASLTEEAQDALTEVRTLVKVDPTPAPPDPLAEFKAQFADDVEGVRFLARLTTDKPAPRSPLGMYNLGCAFASRHDVTWPPPKTAKTPDDQSATAVTTDKAADDATALGWLQLACKDARNKGWITDDPQLEGFRQRRAYRGAFLSAPRTDFFTLSTVKPFATRLRSSGYGDVSLLRTADPVALSPSVTADPNVCEQLVELARLRQGLSSIDGSTEANPLAQLLQAFTDGPPPNLPGLLAGWTELAEGLGDFLEEVTTPLDATIVPLERWAIEILDELTSSGLARRDSLVALSADRQGTLAEEIAATLMRKHQPGAPKDTGDDLADYEKQLSIAIAAWFRRPYEPPRAPRS